MKGKENRKSTKRGNGGYFVAKSKENINCNGEENHREGKGEAFIFGEVGRGGNGETGEGEGEEEEGEEREGRNVRGLKRKGRGKQEKEEEGQGK